MIFIRTYNSRMIIYVETCVDYMDGIQYETLTSASTCILFYKFVNHESPVLMSTIPKDNVKESHIQHTKVNAMVIWRTIIMLKILYYGCIVIKLHMK